MRFIFKNIYQKFDEPRTRALYKAAWKAEENNRKDVYDALREYGVVHKINI